MGTANLGKIRSYTIENMAKTHISIFNDAIERRQDTEKLLRNKSEMRVCPHMSAMLIINADDFGLTASCTRAILEAFSLGLVSSATMITNAPAFHMACNALSRTDIHGCIGIHFNLTEGVPLTDAIKRERMFCDLDGNFHGHINRFRPLNCLQRLAVSAELNEQVQKMKLQNLQITHADSHHHIHTAPFVLPIVLQIMRCQKIPYLRINRNMGAMALYKRAIKAMYNQYLRLQGVGICRYFGSMEDALPGLPSGLTEIMVHPDYDEVGRLVDVQYVDGQKTGHPLAELVRKLGNIQMQSYLQAQIACQKEQI